MNVIARSRTIICHVPLRETSPSAGMFDLPHLFIYYGSIYGDFFLFLATIIKDTFCMRLSCLLLIKCSVNNPIPLKNKQTNVQGS